MASGDSPNLEGSFSDTDSGVASTDYLVIFVADKFISGLNILHAQNTSVDLKPCVMYEQRESALAVP
jgi:hypothetical protein